MVDITKTTDSRSSAYIECFVDSIGQTAVDWFMERLEPSDEILTEYGSKDLKHRLQKATGVNLLNDEFIMLMRAAGYEPAMKRGGQTYFRIRIKRSGFAEWLRRYEHKDTPAGDFARDVHDDFAFPLEDDRQKIEQHLVSRHACSGCITVFRNLWRAYQRQQATGDR